MSFNKICYRSRLMFVIFITTSAMLILLGNSISYHLKDAKPFEFISSSFVNVMAFEVENETNDMLIDLVDDNTEGGFVAEKYSSHGGYAIWFDDEYDADFKMESGRFFSSSDFENRSNVAVVNTDGNFDSKVRGSDKYLILEGEEYQIIGEFKAPTSQYVNEWYVSLASANMKDSKLTGSFILDSNGDNIACAEKICTELRNRNESAEIGYRPYQGLFWGTMGDQQYRAVLILYVILVTLVFVNVFAVASTWINSRRREMSVRCMCGAEWKDSIRLIFIEYYVIVGISFAVAVIIDVIFLHVADYMPIKDQIELLFGDNVYPGGLFTGLILVFITGLMPILYKFEASGKEAIVEGLRC